MYLAKFYKNTEKLDIAESTYLKSIEMLRKLLGNSHIEIAKVLNEFGLLYYEQQKFSQAEFCCQEALDIARNLLRENNFQLFEHLNLLGLASYKQEKYEQAEMLFNEILTIQKDKFGIEHRDTDTALIFHNLSALYDEWDKLEKAVPLCLKAQEVWEKTIGKKDPLFARSLDRLAGIYVRQEKMRC